MEVCVIVIGVEKAVANCLAMGAATIRAAKSVFNDMDLMIYQI